MDPSREFEFEQQLDLDVSPFSEQQVSMLERLTAEPGSEKLYLEIMEDVFCDDYILPLIETARASTTQLSGTAAILYAGFDLFSQDIVKMEDFIPLDRITEKFIAIGRERYAHAIVGQYIGEMGGVEQIPIAINEVDEQARKVIRDEEARVALGRQILQFGSEVLSGVLLAQALEGYDIRYRDRAELAALKSDNDALFACSRFLQTYQVKSALIASAGAGPIKDWMITDWETLMEGLHAAKGNPLFVDNPGVLFRIFGTKKRFLSSQPVFEAHGVPGREFVRLNFSNIVEGSSSTIPDASFDFGVDGHLKGVRGAPLETLARKLRLESQYELLRGEVLGIFCDLVLPAYMVDRVNEPELGVNTNVSAKGKPRDVQTIRQLVVARIRLLEGNTEFVKKEIKKEQRKNPEQHSVIGFVRPLPRGFRATSEARELCRQHLGRELAPTGETFVKPHERGGEGKEQNGLAKTGHRAIRRHVGASVVARQVDATAIKML